MMLLAKKKKQKPINVIDILKQIEERDKVRDIKETR